VTVGAISLAASCTSRSTFASASLGSAFHSTSAFCHASPVGASGRPSM
jgi:hypothetical protein